MTLKSIKVLSVFAIFLLCFITHFLYNWFPNTVFSIFFPVNESIWEHMKMMTSSILIWSVLEYFFPDQKRNIWGRIKNGFNSLKTLFSFTK